jgi:hypothetical protein
MKKATPIRLRHFLQICILPKRHINVGNLTRGYFCGDGHACKALFRHGYLIPPWLEVSSTRKLPSLPLTTDRRIPLSTRCSIT